MMKWSVVPEGDDKRILFGVKEIVDCIKAETGCKPEAENDACNVIRVGVDASMPAESYRFRVFPVTDGQQQVMITGGDASGAMYGCMDFVHEYCEQLRQSGTSCRPYYFRKLFEGEPLPETDRTGRPMIAGRGLWTWGLGVYDWHGYLENMARLKMNEVIFWNDFAPLNGREIVRYAHELGIRVIWGYAWGWDTQDRLKMDVSDEAAKQIVCQYEREYAALGGDGIYFQSFTELEQETLNGRLIADTVVEFVNRTAGMLLSAHPGLRLQFGLHALSVRNRLDVVARTDERVEIIWEDCGDFPYHYIPSHIPDPEETLRFTDRIVSLRQGRGSGTVLKGMICLDWEHFRHQTGPEMLGCADEAVIAERLRAVHGIWKYIQAEWMANGDTARQTVRRWAGSHALYGLVEDGVFGRQIPLPAALFAALLWNSDRPFAETLRVTAQRSDVTLA